jgi:acetyl esterase/lipase
MPSVAARLVESAIWAFARNIRKATDDEVVRDVIQKLEKNAAPIVLPSTIRSTQETRQLQGNQEWQIFHVEPETHAREDKAIVFWHGGGFINNVCRVHRVRLRRGSI